MIATAGTLARIRHTGGRFGRRRFTVNPGLTSYGGSLQSARLGCLLPSGSLVDAALLVVAAGSKVPEASRSDGVAAFDAVGAAWTINGGVSDFHGDPCTALWPTPGGGRSAAEGMADRELSLSVPARRSVPTPA